MSVSAETLRLLIEAGLSGEKLLAVVESMEPEKKALSKGALRTRKWREKQAGDVTVTSPETHHGDVSHAQVVVLTSSLRSEALPPEKATPSTPKGANQARGERLPVDWSPPIGLIASDFGLTHEQYAQQADIFRDYWRAVPGAKGRKTDWPATWRNWLRRASENAFRKTHERPHHDAKFNARQANLASAERGFELASRLRDLP